LNGNVIAQTNALGQVTTMAYDQNNNKTNQIVWLGNQPYATNSYLYDATNNLLTSTDPLGHTNRFSYNNFCQVTTSADALGNITANSYDNNGELLSTINALGDTNYNSYNGGLLVGSSDALGTITTNYYDPATGYLIGTATLDSGGNILSSNTFASDANGNRTNSTAWRLVKGSWTNATTIYTYDAMNRVVQTVDPDGGTNTVVFDLAGNQIATTDPLGRTTSYTYDPLGRQRCLPQCDERPSISN
jgi:YD repeat-containing protein